MLVLEDVHTHYGKIEALHGVSLEVKRGELVSLIGANGAGKTTLLMTVCGSPQASAGRIFLEGREITGDTTANIMRSGMAIVPEGRRVFSGLTVDENLAMGGFFNSKSETRKSQEHVYELFPRLKEREHQRAGTMSGGEQQMLAIGRALMTNPKLLVLDEATEGLAPLVRKRIWEALTAIRQQGMSILLVDKNLADLMKIADRHYIIQRGKVAWSGTSDQLNGAPEIRHRYLEF